MSVYTDLHRGKTQRFLVTYKGQRHFVNTETLNSALALVRTKLLTKATSQPGIEPDVDLATFETFQAKAGVKPSLRW